MRLQVPFLMILGVCTIFASACEPATPTPAPPAVPAKPITGPGVVGENPAAVAPAPGVVAPVPSVVTIVSTKTDPSSLGYAWNCGTVFVAPATITFTVAVSDPAGVVDRVRIIWSLGPGPSADNPDLLWHAVYPTGIVSSGATKTYSLTIPNPVLDLAPETAGGAEFALFWDALAMKSNHVLASSDDVLIPVKPSCPSSLDAPSLPATPVPGVKPPPTKKPEGEQPSCGPNGCPP